MIFMFIGRLSISNVLFSFTSALSKAAHTNAVPSTVCPITVADIILESRSSVKSVEKHSSILCRTRVQLITIKSLYTVLNLMLGVSVLMFITVIILSLL